MMDYDIYCLSCESVVVEAPFSGALLEKLLDKSADKKLCVYQGSCTTEDYRVRKKQETVKMAEIDRLDDA